MPPESYGIFALLYVDFLNVFALYRTKVLVHTKRSNQPHTVHTCVFFSFRIPNTSHLSPATYFFGVTDTLQYFEETFDQSGGRYAVYSSAKCVCLPYFYTHFGWRYASDKLPCWDALCAVRRSIYTDIFSPKPYNAKISREACPNLIRSITLSYVETAVRSPRQLRGHKGKTDVQGYRMSPTAFLDIASPVHKTQCRELRTNL